MSRIWNTQAIHPYTNQHPFINSTPLRCTNPNICSYPHSHPFYTRIRPQPADPSNPFCPTAVGSRSSPASSEHSSVYHGHLHYHSELEQPGNGECSRPQLHQCSRLCLWSTDINEWFKSHAGEQSWCQSPHCSKSEQCYTSSSTGAKLPPSCHAVCSPSWWSKKYSWFQTSELASAVKWSTSDLQSSPTGTAASVCSALIVPAVCSLQHSTAGRTEF